MYFLTLISIDISLLEAIVTGKKQASEFAVFVWESDEGCSFGMKPCPVVF